MTEGYSSAPDGWFTSQCLSEKTLDHHKDLSLVGCEVLARASVNPEGPIYVDEEGGEVVMTISCYIHPAKVV